MEGKGKQGFREHTMKSYKKWRYLFIALLAVYACLALIFFVTGQWLTGTVLVAASLLAAVLFFSFWRAVRRKGIQTEFDIGRVLGRDAKDALDFGDIGILVYNEEYVVTWASSYFREHHIDLINKKLTSWSDEIRILFDQEVDSVTTTIDGQTYEIHRKSGSKVLFVRNITQLTSLKEKLKTESVVVGLMELDNYDEYQSYENDELLNEINTRLRSPLISWARENKIFLRRIRSDRFLMILDEETLDTIRKQNFPILQIVKDEAEKLDVSITLSMVFAMHASDYAELDHWLGELLELVQSRGGDQVAIQNGRNPIDFIGGNSERASQRSTVRVRIVGSSIQDLIKDSGKVFIAGHVNTDYDSMGAALAADNWVKAMGKEAYVVLKDVSRDAHLQETMNEYSKALSERHTFITPKAAAEMMDPAKDLVLMVDHSNPDISSCSDLIKNNARTVIIDHHRRGSNGPSNLLLSYVESTASSTCELMTELLNYSTTSVPIYEAESTIMYLGIVVDTNQFRSHTSQRTFQAAGLLQAWGANSKQVEQALKEDYTSYRTRNNLIEQAESYKGKYLIDALDRPVSRTLLAQVSDSLLGFKGCKAAFAIGVNEANGNVAVSARSDGSVNVQKIMEAMNGGGHFACAALEGENTDVQSVKKELLALLEEQEEK